MKRAVSFLAHASHRHPLLDRGDKVDFRAEHPLFQRGAERFDLQQQLLPSFPLVRHTLHLHFLTQSNSRLSWYFNCLNTTSRVRLCISQLQWPLTAIELAAKVRCFVLFAVWPRPPLLPRPEQVDDGAPSISGTEAIMSTGRVCLSRSSDASVGVSKQNSRSRVHPSLTKSKAVATSSGACASAMILKT